MKPLQLFPTHPVIFCFSFLPACLNYNRESETGNPPLFYSEYLEPSLLGVNPRHVSPLPSLSLLLSWLWKLVRFKQLLNYLFKIHSLPTVWGGEWIQVQSHPQCCHRDLLSEAGAVHLPGVLSGKPPKTQSDDHCSLITSQ